MDHDKSEVKQDGDQSETAHKSDHKAEPKPKEEKRLIQFMEDNYEQYVSNVQSFDEFYHAIHQLIEMFCEERGQLQYRIPEKEKLREVYEKHHMAEGEVKREEFMKMSKEVIRPSSFTIGKATKELLLYLFGIPMCALVVKRVLPGLGWLSDDVVIPVATTGSVAYLIKTKQL